MIFAAVFSILIYRLLSTFQIGIFEEAGLIFLLAPLVAFYFYLRKYHIYNGGWQGEKQVAKLLARTLSDNYYLLNDLYLRDGGGDIDHVVLGPNGVFVLETKTGAAPSTATATNGREQVKVTFQVVQVDR